MSTRGFVFLCANSTEQECYDRMLFGGKEKYKKEVPEIEPGDFLFLFNYQEGLLHGVFSANSSAQMNIEPNAWDGEYPWQVRVIKENLYKPLSRADLVGTLSFIRNKYPPAQLSEQELTELLKLFSSKKRLPNFENTIPYTSDDGHRLRSRGEKAIDDWLYNHKILHAYEKQLIRITGIAESMYCDFYLPNEEIYIEFWGLDSKEYNNRKNKKIEFYKANDLKLVELLPEDIRNLDAKLDFLISDGQL